MGPQRFLLHRTPEISCSTMACSHAVCRISSVIVEILTSSLRQTRSRRSCPRRCFPRRSSVRRSITRRSTTRRPCPPLPLFISCLPPAVQALKKSRNWAARPARHSAFLMLHRRPAVAGKDSKTRRKEGCVALSSDHWPPRRRATITSVQPRRAACLASGVGTLVG